MFEDQVKLGPCTLIFGDLQIDLTSGGVTLHVEPEMTDINVDQYGTGPVDHRITGWNVRAIVPLAQTDYDSIKAVATFLEEVEAGKLTDRQLGTSMRSVAKQLTLHPTEYSDNSHDVILYLASPVTAMELGFDYSDQRVYNAEFVAYPKANADPGSPGNYFEMGGVPASIPYHVATFTVTSSAGAVVEQGAEVSIAGISQTKFTDANGEATFLLRPDEYAYAVSKTGFTTALDVFDVVDADVAVPVALT